MMHSWMRIHCACSCTHTVPCCLCMHRTDMWLPCKACPDPSTSKVQRKQLAPRLGQGYRLCVGTTSETVSSHTPACLDLFRHSDALQADASANASDVSGLLLGGTLVPDQLLHGVVVILTPDGSLGETITVPSKDYGFPTCRHSPLPFLLLYLHIVTMP